MGTPCPSDFAGPRTQNSLGAKSGSWVWWVDDLGILERKVNHSVCVRALPEIGMVDSVSRTVDSIQESCGEAGDKVRKSSVESR